MKRYCWRKWLHLAPLTRAQPQEDFWSPFRRGHTLLGILLASEVLKEIEDLNCYLLNVVEFAATICSQVTAPRTAE